MISSTIMTKGLLIVHGVGAQAPGESARKLLNGLSLVPGARIPHAGSDSREAEVAGMPIRLYEVHWADLLQGEITRDTFSAKEFQAFAWFPWLNRKNKVSLAGGDSFVTTFLWTLVLPLLSIALAFPYFGARLIVAIFQKDDWEAPGARGGAGGIRALWRDAKARADREATRRTRLEDTIDEYVGDVFNYVNSAGQANFPDGRERDVPPGIQNAYVDIAERFQAQLLKAATECEEIQVLAHSLGTVVSYHGLFGLQYGDAPGVDKAELDAARRKVSHLYTIGSPLEKIRFFWPKLINPEVAAGSRELHWENFVSWFDPVAGVLKHFDQWGTVRNQRLLGGGFVTGHVVYEKHPKFLQRLVRGLGGGAIEIARTPWQKFRNWAFLLGETLIAPLVFLLLALTGAAIWLAVVMMLPWLASLLFRPDFMPQLDPVVFDRAAFGFGVVMTAVFLVNSRVYASKIHRGAWAPGVDAGVENSDNGSM